MTVKELDQTWNRALAPMPSGKSISAEQKDMMDKTMASKAVMGVSMMSLPTTDVMEYALTKGMGAQQSGPPPSLVIPLNDKTTVTARRTEVTKTDDGYTWRGLIEGSDEPVTLLWWPSGRLAGTVTHGGHMFVIKNMGGDMHGMVEYSPDKMPPDHGAASKSMMQKMNMKEDPSSTRATPA